METRTDPGARDPSPPVYKFLRALVSGVIGGAVAWLVAHKIIGEEVRGQVQEALMVLFMGSLMAFGAYSRDRGWFIGKFLALPLAFLLVGCAATPLKAWRTAVDGYTAAGVAMAVYCDERNFKASASACVKAAAATLKAEPLLEATNGMLQSGAISDADLEARTKELEALTETVQEVNP